MQGVTAFMEESEERQDRDLICPASPLGCKNGGPSSESLEDANVTELVGTRVALLVLLMAVLLKEQGVAGPAKTN